MTEREIFGAALQLEDADSRRNYLAKMCGTDPALRRRVECLLQAYGRAGDFLQHLAVGGLIHDMSLPITGEAALGNQHRPDDASQSGPRERGCFGMIIVEGDTEKRFSFWAVRGRKVWASWVRVRIPFLPKRYQRFAKYFHGLMSWAMQAKSVK